MNIAELRAKLESIEAERRGIHEAAGDNPLTDEQQTRWDALDTDEADMRARLADAEQAEQRAQRVTESRSKWRSVQVGKENDPFAGLQNVHTMSRQNLIDANLRALDGKIDDTGDQKHVERLFKRHAGDRDWAANLLARSRPQYESAWAKLMCGRGELLTVEERAAVAVGTNSQGGYLVPTHLDPTLILTNTGSANAIRPIARTTTLTVGNVWHGVSTAGVNASFDAELAEVSDDSPTFSNPSVTLYTARAFVQASIEAMEDVANLTSDVLMLFADARNRLEGDKHCNGNGTSEPKGIFTAINATAAQQTVSTTGATIGLVDLQAVYKALGRRWRASSTWVMNPTYLLAVQALGTALSASYTSNLTQPLTDQLLGRPVVETDDAPITQTTTVKDQEILLGDFSQFLIVDKPGGMSVRYVPDLFNTGNNLPTGASGWFSYWRNGSDVLTAKAFELLVDKTTA
jgi:HK97 family phage major capsid protein